MSSTPSNEFPQKISKYFMFNGQVFPRGGVLKYRKTTVLLGATSNYVIAVRQNLYDLMITKITGLDKIPIAPNNIKTIDDLLLHAYKVIFTPKYAEIVRGNKTLAVGIIYSKLVQDNRTVYWLYDVEENTKMAIELVKPENIIIKYIEISQDELNEIIKRIFNFEGTKEVLRFFLSHGLFTLDSYGD
jgi:hypothetical protein